MNEHDETPRIEKRLLPLLDVTLALLGMFILLVGASGDGGATGEPVVRLEVLGDTGDILFEGEPVVTKAAGIDEAIYTSLVEFIREVSPEAMECHLFQPDTVGSTEIDERRVMELRRRLAEDDVRVISRWTSTEKEDR